MPPLGFFFFKIRAAPRINQLNQLTNVPGFERKISPSPPGVPWSFKTSRCIRWSHLLSSRCFFLVFGGFPESKFLPVVWSFFFWGGGICWIRIPHSKVAIMLEDCRWQCRMQPGAWRFSFREASLGFAVLKHDPNDVIVPVELELDIYLDLFWD